MDYLKKTSLKSNFDWVVVKATLPHLKTEFRDGIIYKFLPFPRKTDSEIKPLAEGGYGLVSGLQEALAISGQRTCLETTVKTLMYSTEFKAEVVTGPLEDFYEELADATSLGSTEPDGERDQHLWNLLLQSKGWSKENLIISENIDNIITFDGANGFGYDDDVPDVIKHFPCFMDMYSPGGPCWDPAIIDDDPEDPLVADHSCDKYLEVQEAA